MSECVWDESRETRLNGDASCREPRCRTGAEAPGELRRDAGCLSGDRDTGSLLCGKPDLGAELPKPAIGPDWRACPVHPTALICSL